MSLRLQLAEEFQRVEVALRPEAPCALRGILVAVGLLGALLGTPALATFQPGVHQYSLGRFAEWPRNFDGASSFYYEEDLVQRIHPDALERSHKGLIAATWNPRFGWAHQSDPLASIQPFTDNAADIWITDVQWTRKSFAVVRRLNSSSGPVIDGEIEHCSEPATSATYAVTVNNVGPGTWISSSLDRFYVEGRSDYATNNAATGFSHVWYYSSAQDQLVAWPLPANGPVVLPDWNRSDIEHNYVILAGEQNASVSSLNVVIPLMVSFPPYVSSPEHGLVGLSMVSDAATNRSFVCLDFPTGSTEVKNIGLSLPFGIKGFMNGATGMAYGNPIATTFASMANTMVCHLPTQVTEDFEEDTAADVVRIRNTVTSYDSLDPLTLSAFQFVTIPPLVVRAAASGIPGATHPSGPFALTNYPTKYGRPILAISGTNTVEYTLPAAPRHDVHVVPHAVETEYQQIAKQIIDHNNFANQVHTTDPFSVMNDRGEGYALAMVPAGSRESYLRRMRYGIVNLLNAVSVNYLNVIPDPNLEGGDDLPTNYKKNHGTNSAGVAEYSLREDCATLPIGSFWAALWRGQNGVTPPISPSAFPHDIDAATGTILAYVYEYLLWSGDIALVEALWSGGGEFVPLKDFYSGIRALHDWAWMGGSASLWGESGSRMDMLGAQYAGVHATAGILSALNAAQYGDEARFVRYLEAKLALPLCLRLDAQAEIAEHYHVLPPAVGTQIVPGFSEMEPSGPMMGYGIRFFENWSDWTLSGERVHPMQFEAYERLYGTRYSAVLDKFQQHTPNSYHLGSLRATFVESKVLALARNGRYTSTAEALTQIKNFSRVGSQAADFGLHVTQSYEQFRTPDTAGWNAANFTLEPDDEVERLAHQRSGIAVYPAVLENMTSPVRIGGWGKAGVKRAQLGSDGKLRVEVRSAPASVYLQCDDFTGNFAGTTGYNARWKTVQWTINSANTLMELDLTGNGAVIGSPASAPPRTNQLSYGTFSELGESGSNLESGWLGNEAFPTNFVRVEDPGDLPGDSKALQLHRSLAQSAFGLEDMYAYQAAYLLDESATTANQYPYLLRFRYKIASANTRLQLYILYRDDQSAFKVPSDAEHTIPVTLLNSTQHESYCAAFSPAVNVLPSETSVFTAGSLCQSGSQFAFETEGEWRDFEVRGTWHLPANAVAPGAIKVQFSPIFDHCKGDQTEMDVWLDDVELVKYASTDDPGYGFASFRYPSEGTVFEDGVGALANIPIANFPDQRVPTGATTFRDASDPSQQVPAPGMLSKSLEWWDSTKPTGQEWQPIPLPELSYSDGDWYINGLAIWKRPVGWSHYGATRLRVRYWKRVGTVAVLAGSADSDWFLILPPPTPFTHHSAESQIEFAGKTPYSILTLNYDQGEASDKGQDFLVSYVGEEDLELYKNTTNPLSGHASFAKSLLDLPQTTQRPQDARGLSLARFDDNLAPVVLVASPRQGAAYGTRVYALENRGNGSRFYEDITTPSGVVSTRSLFPATDASGDDLFAHAWAGAWGKVNPDDDGMALYLARSEYVVAADGSGVPTPAEIDGHGKPDQLLRWNRALGQFENLSATALPYSGPSETVAATWAPLVGGDNLPDLYVSHLGPKDLTATPGWSVLYRGKADGSFEDVSGMGTGDPLDPNITQEGQIGGASGGPSTPLIGRFGAVSGANAMDIDRDGDLDLALSRRYDDAGSPQLNLAVLRNEASGFWNRAFTGPTSLRPMQSLSLVDLDNNRVQDFLGSPVPAADMSVPIYLGFELGTDLQYVDRSGTFGLAAGATQAVALGDYDGDSDADILLGRGTNFYYSNPLTPQSTSAIALRLVANGSGNAEYGIGAVAWLERPGADQVLSLVSLDGGNGRGMQSLLALLGSGGSSTWDVKVRWPDGYLQTTSGHSAGQTLTVTDNHYPTLQSGSVSASYLPSSGTTQWVFRWRCTYSASKHQVEIWPNGGQGNCALPIPHGQSSLKLEAGMPGVTVTSVPIPGGFQITLRYELWCEAPCNYTYKVHSYSAGRKSSSALKTLNVSICGQIEG